MKSKSIYFLLLLFLVGLSPSIVKSQTTITVDVTITDNCGASGSYTVYAYVYCTSTQFSYCDTPPATLCTNCTTGPNNGLTFNCTVPQDSEHKIYQVKIAVVKNGQSSCNGQGSSIAYNSDDLYSLSIPVSVTLH